MAILPSLHYHPAHRARQIRWVLPAGVLLVAAVLAAMGVLYYFANQDVGNEFFKAHKTITHTGQLLNRGVLFGGAVLILLALGICAWAFTLTHRIVRPVHTMHRAIDGLAGGNLSIRVQLHRHDEFFEVGTSLNRLVTEFSDTLARVHDLVDRIEVLAQKVATEEQDQATEDQLHALTQELNETMEFFRQGPETIVREDD